MQLYRSEINDNSTTTPSYAVANLTGGVGKTTTSRLLDYMAIEAGRPLRAVAIEDGSVERLSKLVDGLDHMRLEPPPEAFEDAAGDHTTAMLLHWNKVGERLAEGGQLLDFGANGVQRFVAWAEQAKPRALLEDAPVLNVLVPVTSQGSSAADGLAVLLRLKAVERHFMKLRLIAVYNGYTGSVAKAEEPSVVELRSYVERNKIPVLALPHGAIGIANEHSFTELATAKPREFAKLTGQSPMAANGKLMLFRTWLEQAVAAAEGIALFPTAKVLPMASPASSS